MERTDKASKNGFVQEGGVDTVRVTVAMDGCALPVELNDTLPARALARLLPLDLTFIGTGIALCAPLPVELPWDDALIHCGWRDGDINYSVQGGWLAVLCGGNMRPDTLAAPIIVAFLVACVVAMLFGAFNGVLVAVFKIQPMIATLILYTAGRSIAAWINNNELPVVSDETLTYFGEFIPGIPIPTPFFIAVACMIVIGLVLKFTNLRLYTQAVGINENSSKLNGLNPVFIKILSFVILGLCVAVVGLIKVARISTINYSVIAKDIEMDAILAVALGGNALSGGKFNMTASIIGAYVIQCLTTTLYKFQVRSDALPAYKAIVVIVLVIVSAPVVREKFNAFMAKRKVKEAA